MNSSVPPPRQNPSNGDPSAPNLHSQTLNSSGIKTLSSKRQGRRTPPKTNSQQGILIASLLGLATVLLATIAFLLLGGDDDDEIAQSKNKSSLSQTKHLGKPLNNSLKSLPITVSDKTRGFPLEQAGEANTKNISTGTSEPETNTTLEIAKTDEPSGSQAAGQNKRNASSRRSNRDSIPTNDLINPFETFPASADLPNVNDKEGFFKDITMISDMEIPRIESLQTTSLQVIATDESKWEITDSSKRAKANTVFANLSRTENNELSWKWAGDIEPQNVTELTNAWMVLKYNDFTHKLALRTPLPISGFSWDFKNGATKRKYAEELSKVHLKNAPKDTMTFIKITISGQQPRTMKMGKKFTFKIPDAKIRKRNKIVGAVIAEYRTSQLSADANNADIKIEQRLSFRVDSVESPLTRDHIRKRSNEIKAKLDNAQRAVQLVQNRLNKIARAIRAAKQKYNGERLKAELIELGQQQRNAAGKLRNKLRTFKKYDALFKIGLPNFKKQVLDKIINTEVSLSIYAENSDSNMGKLELATSQ